MNREIEAALVGRSADIVRFVDLSALPEARELGCSKAVLIGMVLSQGYIRDVLSDHFVFDPERDEYLTKEHDAEALADWLAETLAGKGYRTISQSTGANLARGSTEQCYASPELIEGISLIPQKTIARIAGLGFIGKNNLLVTGAYGCALCICSVLTDAPIEAVNAPEQPSRCGACDACVRRCPSGALLGSAWTKGGGRESVVDVGKCVCPLACMLACPWTLRYAYGEAP